MIKKLLLPLLLLLVTCLGANTALAQNATITSFTASPYAISTGGSSILTWTSINTTSCTGTNFTTGGNTGGSVVVSPAFQTVYSLNCVGSVGGPVNAQITIVIFNGGVSFNTNNTWNGSNNFANGLYINGWNANYGVLNAQVGYNASGSSNSYTASIVNGSSTLHVSGTDFVAGQGVEVEGAGAANTAVAPTGLAAAAVNWVTENPFPINFVIKPTTNNAGGKYYEVLEGYSGINQCTEVGTTATCEVTSGYHLPFTVGDSVTVASNGVSGYNGTFTVTKVWWDGTTNLNWQFNYTTTGSLGTGSGGTVVYTGTSPGGGVSGASEPTWPQSASATVTDGTIVWKECTTTCGGTSYSYTLVARDSNRAFAAPTSAVTVSNASSLSNVAYNTLTWTAGTNDVDMIICRGGTAVDIVPAGDDFFIDVGNAQIYGTHPDIPSGVCTAGPANGPLVSTVSYINGTTFIITNNSTSTNASATIVHDDTAALNAMATALLNATNTGTNGYCPEGTYLTTGAWLFNAGTSGSGLGITLSGANGTNRGGGGCHILYHGSALASTGQHGAIVTNGLNGSVLQHIFADSNDVATASFQIENSDGSHSSSGVELFYDQAASVPHGSNASGVSVGFNGCTGNQVSEVTVRDLNTTVAGFPAWVGYGFRSWCGNNQKNFYIDGIGCSQFYGCTYTTSNGYVEVKREVTGGDTGIENTALSENFKLDGAESEGNSTTGVRLGSFTGSGNPMTVMLLNISFQSDATSDNAAIITSGNNVTIVSNDNQFFYRQPYVALSGTSHLVSQGDFWANDDTPDQIARTSNVLGYPANCYLYQVYSTCTQIATIKGAMGGTFGSMIVLSPFDNSAKPGFMSVETFGAVSTAADNTAAINLGLETCEIASCILQLPGSNVWHITGSLLLAGTTGQEGFGFVGPGIISEDGTNLPIIDITTTGMQDVELARLNLTYSSAQSSSDTNSVCIRVNMGAVGDSFYNSHVHDLQCTNAYRGIASQSTTAGSWWGNLTERVDFKGLSGAAIYLIDSGANSPNNSFKQIYINPGSGTTCADTHQVHLEYMSVLLLENIEGNNVDCGMIYTANDRGVLIQQSRDEAAVIPASFAGKGLIEANGDCVIVDGFEFQSIQNNTGGNLFLFQDNGSFGCPDVLRGNLVIYQQTISSNSGSMYGEDSATVAVMAEPWQQWYTTSGYYLGDVYTGDASPNNVIVEAASVPKPSFSSPGAGAGVGTDLSLTEDTACNGKDCYITLNTGQTTPPTTSATIFTITWTVTGGFFIWNNSPHCQMYPVNRAAIDLAATAGKTPVLTFSGGGTLPTSSSVVGTWTSGTTALGTNANYVWELKCGG